MLSLAEIPGLCPHCSLILLLIRCFPLPSHALDSCAHPSRRRSCPALASLPTSPDVFTVSEFALGSHLQKAGRESSSVACADSGQSPAPHLWACLLQIIGTIPLMPNPGPSSQAASGTQGLQVQPITPQLLTNAQGQIIATVIGNQILPVINTQGITLSPIKPGQQVTTPHLLPTHPLFGLSQWKSHF